MEDLTEQGLNQLFVLCSKAITQYNTAQKINIQ